MGESAESFWCHKESWADLWTSNYTDQEPKSLYVATMDDSVAGYLAGCMDTAAMTPSTDETMKAVIRKHWLLFRRGTAGFQAASERRVHRPPLAQRTGGIEFVEASE